ncbi:MAG: hypothetical protein AAF292_12845 [Pseudomonadota bacterium]
MSAFVFVLLAALLCWIGVLAFRWWATSRAEAMSFGEYTASGELNSRVSRRAFRKSYMRSEGPLFGTVLLGSTFLAAITLPILLAMFNFVWRSVWENSGKPPLLELGELPHLLILTIVMVAALFAIAWLCMLWYHTNRPPKLRTEIARLNSEASEA